MAESTDLNLIQKRLWGRMWFLQKVVHPHTKLVIDMPDQQTCTDAAKCFEEGGLTQIMVKRGDLLVVHYTQNYNVQALFDAYGRD